MGTPLWKTTDAPASPFAHVRHKPAGTYTAPPPPNYAKRIWVTMLVVLAVLLVSGGVAGAVLKVKADDRREAQELEDRIEGQRTINNYLCGEDYCGD